VNFHYLEHEYGYPHMVGHRQSLANGIYEGCKKERAITFHFSTKVSSIKSFSPEPTFTATPREGGGEPYQVEADILFACDGIKSLIRMEMLKRLGVHAKVEDTQQSAYRIMLHRDQLASDPELLELIERTPVSRARATRNARAPFSVQIDPESPYGVSLAI